MIGILLAESIKYGRGIVVADDYIALTIGYEFTNP
jgi:hypothetical protein